MSRTLTKRAAALFQIKALPYIVLTIVVLSHRLFLFADVYSHYVNLIGQDEGNITWQYLPLSILQNKLLIGMWYLQQNPPIAQTIIGILIKITGSMHALSLALIGVQAVISLVSTLLLYRLLTLIGILNTLALTLSAVFALSADIIFMEYYSYGQMIYGTLCMPLLLTTVLCFFHFLNERKSKYLLICGVLVAGLALTRASFGYLALPLVIYLLCIRIRWRELAVFILPILILQGTWALKNAFVYGYFSLPATS